MAQSRNEAILENMLGSNNQLEPPQSRIETLLLELNGDLATKYGCSISMSIDSSTYVLTLSLINKAGNIIDTQTIDLPLESVVVSGSYDSTNKKIVLVLESGSTIDVPVGDLVSGLVNDVQIDGTSIVNNGVANVPIATHDTTSPASTGHLGVVKGRQALGTYIAQDGAVAIYPSVATLVKTGTDNSRPLTSKLADATAFYGLAKVAGDTTQQNYAVDDATYGIGHYTDDAKQAIQQMIGILSVQGVGF